jgi:predicted DCC family thiol-disulfide oxidoreductase YuxK
MTPIQSHEHSLQAPWLILFDGVCGWCTGWVRFLIKHDSHKRFQFAPLQSPLGQHLLVAFDLSQENFSTFVLINPDGFFTKSAAALNIVRHLGGIWRILYAFILVPKILRDGVYDLIARYRYQLRGTLTTCYQPPPEYQDRFLYDV